jgi:hypothetical protein
VSPTIEEITITYREGTPDTTAPNISALDAAPADDGSATISWTTDEPSDSRVEYGTSDTVATSKTIDPLLASSLANNGGPTKTIALLKGSPARNEIPNATNGCGTEITTDQRGVSRPQGRRCDVGAFEKEVSTP